MICAWTHLVRPRSAPGITHIESAPDGWWYTAPIPGRRRVLAFHTDSETSRRLELRTDLVAAAADRGSLADILTDSDLASSTPVRFCAAGGSRAPEPATGTRLSVGDAAASFDPLSGQGLFHALYSGLTGARTVRAMLDGDRDGDATRRYRQEMDAIWHTYRRMLQASYGAERRYLDHAFWRRRHALAPPDKG